MERSQQFGMKLFNKKIIVDPIVSDNISASGIIISGNETHKKGKVVYSDSELVKPGDIIIYGYGHDWNMNQEVYILTDESHLIACLNS